MPCRRSAVTAHGRVKIRMSVTSPSPLSVKISMSCNVALYELVHHDLKARLVLDFERGAVRRAAVGLGCCREDPPDDGLPRRLTGEDRGKQGDVIGERRNVRRIGPERSRPFGRGGAEFCVCEVRVDLRTSEFSSGVGAGRVKLDSPRAAQDFRKSRRSALIVSASVVGIPCGNPL
jgi:hypothetical protein